MANTTGQWFSNYNDAPYFQVSRSVVTEVREAGSFVNGIWQPTGIERRIRRFTNMRRQNMTETAANSFAESATVITLTPRVERQNDAGAHYVDYTVEELIQDWA